MDRPPRREEPPALARRRASPGEDASVGLCARCAHARTQESAKGSVFWRCAASDDDPALLRYPPLPVRDCPAFSEGDPAAKG